MPCGVRSFECSRARRQLPLTPSPCLRRGRGQGEGSRLKPLTPEATDFAITSGTFAIANFALVSDPNHRSAAMGEPDPDIAGQLRKFQKELSGGTVALVLLAVLRAAGEPLYGYQIAKQIGRAHV